MSGCKSAQDNWSNCPGQRKETLDVWGMATAPITGFASLKRWCDRRPVQRPFGSAGSFLSRFRSGGVSGIGGLDWRPFAIHRTCCPAYVSGLRASLAVPHHQSDDAGDQGQHQDSSTRVEERFGLDRFLGLAAVLRVRSLDQTVEILIVGVGIELKLDRRSAGWGRFFLVGLSVSAGGSTPEETSHLLFFRIAQVIRFSSRESHPTRPSCGEASSGRISASCPKQGSKDRIIEVPQGFEDGSIGRVAQVVFAKRRLSPLSNWSQSGRPPISVARKAQAITRCGKRSTSAL